MGSLVCSLLGQRIDMQPLVTFLRANPCVPARRAAPAIATTAATATATAATAAATAATTGTSATTNAIPATATATAPAPAPVLVPAVLSFEPAQRVIWLPPPLVSRLAPLGLLERWFGGLAALATDSLNDSTGWSDIWRASCHMPTPLMLSQNRVKFKIPGFTAATAAGAGAGAGGGVGGGVGGGGGAWVHSALAVTAAFAETLHSLPSLATSAAAITAGAGTGAGAGGGGGGGRHKPQSKPTTHVDPTPSATLCGSWLPPLDLWPIFVTDSGAEVRFMLLLLLSLILARND